MIKTVFTTGEIKLKRPMSELALITGGKQPAILTIMADEEVIGVGEPPAKSTLADMILILDDVVNSPPYFHNAKYVLTNTYLFYTHNIHECVL